MSAYRQPAEMPDLSAETSVLRGLVRENGSNCTCRPPGWLWRWWFDVVFGDRWYCNHGGGWRFRSSYETLRHVDHWEALEKESGDT